MSLERSHRILSGRSHKLYKCQRFINVYALFVAAIFVLLASSLATTENKEIIEVERTDQQPSVFDAVFFFFFFVLAFIPVNFISLRMN